MKPTSTECRANPIFDTRTDESNEPDQEFGPMQPTIRHSTTLLRAQYDFYVLATGARFFLVTKKPKNSFKKGNFFRMI